MKRDFVQAIKSIQKRANSKIVNMNDRYFLIGGMTVTKNTSDIYQFRILKQEQDKYQVQWRPLKFQNNIFTPRNSFSACASQKCLYIWGGLQINQATMKQKCLSNLIEVDIQKGRMRLVPLKQNIEIHSSSLFYDKQTNSLIAFGGTNQQVTQQCYLYTLKLDQSQTYQWKKKQVKNIAEQGIIWQHSANIVRKSIFTGQQGKFMVVIGGCKLPHSPYKKVVQFNLQILQITKTTQLDQAVVAHQSVYCQQKQIIYVIGGANGGGFNRTIYSIKQGKIQKIQGHNAVGCACVLTKQGLVVYGGLFTPQMLNEMIIYHQ